jgi:hypothetical protein
VTPEKFDRRRREEGMIYESIGKTIVYKRLPMRKQKKLRNKIRLANLEYTFFQFSHMIRVWAMRNYNLNPRQLDVLFYLYPIGIFTRKDFHRFVKEMAIRDYTLFTFFTTEGWITEWAKEGTKKFYVLSHKANGLIKKLHRMALFEEEIPMSERRNVVVRSRQKKDKDLVELFKVFNNKVKSKQNE